MSGNTNELQHLINPQPKGSPTRSEINFGFGLRKYNSVSNLQQEKAWKFPGLKGAVWKEYAGGIARAGIKSALAEGAEEGV